MTNPRRRQGRPALRPTAIPPSQCELRKYLAWVVQELAIEEGETVLMEMPEYYRLWKMAYNRGSIPPTWNQSARNALWEVEFFSHCQYRTLASGATSSSAPSSSASSMKHPNPVEHGDRPFERRWRKCNNPGCSQVLSGEKKCIISCSNRLIY